MSGPEFAVRTPMYLLLRPSDHLIAGVTWSGVSRASDAGRDAGTLVTASDTAWLLLVLPPQHTAERTFPDETGLAGLPEAGTRPLAGAMLSGTAQVGIRLDQGEIFDPTTASILSLLDSAAPLGPSGDPHDEPTTLLEIPWHLIVQPRTSQGGVCAFRPVGAPTALGPDEAAALWRLRVEPDRADAGRAGLVAVSDVGPGVRDLLPIALDGTWRARLVAETARRPANLDRLELSSLGGTLTAGGDWDNFTWQHRAVLGRDMEVQIVAQGVLYPLGHRAIYQRSVKRVFDPAADGGAILRQIDLVIVTDAVPEHPVGGRAFPFDEVEITEKVFTVRPPVWKPTPSSQGLDVYFRPTAAHGQIRFPVRCRTGDRDLEFQLPLLFVADLSPTVASLTNPRIAAELSQVYGNEPVEVPAGDIDLIRADAQEPEDVQEVHTLTIAGTRQAGRFAPMLSSLEIALPAVRALVGAKDAGETYTVTFSEEYLREGVDGRTILDLVEGKVGLNFTGQADRSGGLVAPTYAADAISRIKGPVVRAALPDPATGAVNVRAFFSPDAKILGFPLRDLLGAVTAPPAVISQLGEGAAPVMTMEWNQVKLTSPMAGSSTTFTAGPAATLDLKVTVAPRASALLPRAPSQTPAARAVTEDALGNDTRCAISDFALRLPPSDPLIELHFDRLTFHQRGRAPATVNVEGLRVGFLGELRLLEALGAAVDLAGSGPQIDVTPSGITAGYGLELPEVSSGVFVLRNVAVGTRISIPFDNRPISMTMGFASPANRFALTVLMFGGGGYVEIELTQHGLQRLDLALEFGALVALNFVVASAEVHALGGVRFQLAGDQVEVSGYLRIGGCVDILGLVSVSIEMCVTLSYRSESNALMGRATLVVEIDLFLWSESVELDSGEWVLAGGTGTPEPVPALAPPPQAPVDPFEDYWSCFADQGDSDA